MTSAKALSRNNVYISESLGFVRPEPGEGRELQPQVLRQASCDCAQDERGPKYRHYFRTTHEPALPHRGFTLLEVLLALALLAIAGMSVLSLSGESVRNTPILEQRLLARLVADNQMTELHLQKKWPTLGWQRKEYELADQKWFVRFRSVKTADEGFRGIDVEVRAQPDENDPILANLRSYMGKQS